LVEFVELGEFNWVGGWWVGEFEFGWLVEFELGEFEFEFGELVGELLVG
jgi:hypothetical protein